MHGENGAAKVVPKRLSRAGKRRYRHTRTPCPEPPPGEASWLRGRRKSPGVLLALHHAAVLLRTGDQTSAQLYQGSVYEACHSEKQTWFPKYEVFFRWLRHHRIARKIDRNLWAASLNAAPFALISNRDRVRKIGALILARERAVSAFLSGEGNLEELHQTSSNDPGFASAKRTLPYLSPIHLDPPTNGPD